MLERGKMSTWLHDGWIGANRPKSTGGGECVKSTDDVAMAMGLADELDTEGKEREGTAVDVTL